MYVIIILDVVRVCGVTLSLGRKTCDHDERTFLGESLSCRAHSNKQYAFRVIVYSTCRRRDVSVPVISCSRALQLYCGSTHAFTQYIKLK